MSSIVTYENFKPLRTIKVNGRTYATAEVVQVVTTPARFGRPTVTRVQMSIGRLSGNPIWFDVVTMTPFPPEDSAELWRLYHERYMVRTADDLAAAGIATRVQE